MYATILLLFIFYYYYFFILPLKLSLHPLQGQSPLFIAENFISYHQPIHRLSQLPNQSQMTESNSFDE